MTRPTDLRVDHLVDPLGIGASAPGLSRKLPSGAPCTWLATAMVTHLLVELGATHG